jgi:antitoxin (DNA-binding transcriptional repressor) of toxin-antitoxin stability system
MLVAEFIEPIDIDDNPDLTRFADEVNVSRTSRVLRLNGHPVAKIVPVDEEVWQVRKPTADDIAAFRSAAGSWSDIDGDALKEYIYRAREEGTRPPSRP